MSALMPLWIATTIFIVDAERRIVVLLPDGRQKMRAKAKAEGVAIGRAKGFEEGLAKGLAEGIADRLAKARAEGIADRLAKARAEGYAGGFAEGFAQGRAKSRSIIAAWRQWNARRMDFAARSEPFDEPPPDYTDYLSGDEPKRGD